MTTAKKIHDAIIFLNRMRYLLGTKDPVTGKPFPLEIQIGQLNRLRTYAKGVELRVGWRIEELESRTSKEKPIAGRQIG